MAKDKAAQLDKICKDRSIGSNLKVKIMKTLVWSIAQYGAESWTVGKIDTLKIEAFELWCWRKVPGMSWRDCITNASVLKEIQREREIVAMVARLKLKYYVHVVRGSARELAVSVMEGGIAGR